MPFAEAGTGANNVAAGLPNITGAYINRGFDAGSPSKGALYTDGSLSYTIAGHGGGWNGSGGVGLDASRSTNIYGNSTTVQPSAIQLIPQLRY